MEPNERGAIRHPAAYARGKMLDHSGWQRGEKLPRLITPSDIDGGFDAAGRVLLMEVSSETDRWSEISVGQRRLYQSLVRGTEHVAVVAHHEVGLFEERLIRTREDIVSFQIMLHFAGMYRYTRVFHGTAVWDRFVLRWTNRPEDTFHICTFEAEPPK